MLEGANPTEHKSFYVPLVLLNRGPFFFFHDCTELQAHYEFILETEGVNEDPDEVEQDGPRDPPGSEPRAIYEDARLTSALIQGAQYQELQQELNFQLERLRRETGRSVRVEQ